MNAEGVSPGSALPDSPERALWREVRAPSQAPREDSGTARRANPSTQRTNAPKPRFPRARSHRVKPQRKVTIGLPTRRIGRKRMRRSRSTRQPGRSIPDYRSLSESLGEKRCLRGRPSAAKKLVGHRLLQPIRTCCRAIHSFFPTGGVGVPLFSAAGNGVAPELASGVSMGVLALV